MAESIARYDAADVIDACSAGLIPLGYVPEMTKDTLTKNGYSAGLLTSKPVAHEIWDAADIVINMSGTPREGVFREYGKVEDWIVDDPYGADAQIYQTIFEGIQRRVRQLAEDLRHKRQSPESEK
jgi:protein-tyrosine-phosphatase